MPKVAVYTRVSTEYQTVESQARAISRDLNFILRREVPDSDILYFQDDGVSATKQKSLRDRRGGSALLKAVDDGIIGEVVVIGFDRLWRHGQTGINEFEEVRQQGVKFYATQGANILDTQTADGFISFWSSLGRAQFEIMQLSERVKRKQEFNLIQGKAITGAVYGWDVGSGGVLIPNLNEQAVIQWIRNNIASAQGRSGVGMAKYLNRLGVKTKYASLDPDEPNYNPDSQWSSSSVYRAIRSKTQLSQVDNLQDRMVNHPQLGKIRIGYAYGKWDLGADPSKWKAPVAP